MAKNWTNYEEQNRARYALLAGLDLPSVLETRFGYTPTPRKKGVWQSEQGDNPTHRLHVRQKSDGSWVFQDWRQTGSGDKHGGTLTHFLRDYAGWSSKEIQQFAEERGLTKTFSSERIAPVAVPKITQADFDRWEEKALAHLAKQRPGKGETYLTKRFIPEEASAHLQGFVANRTGVRFPLKRFDLEGNLRTTSTLDYFFGKEGNRVKLFLKQEVNGSRGLSILSPEGVKADRIVVCESPIDALSFRALALTDPNYSEKENTTLYVATCGYIGETQKQDLEILFGKKKDAELVFALDNDDAGKKLTLELVKIAEQLGMSHSYFLPKEKDWNEDLEKVFREKHPEQQQAEDNSPYHTPLKKLLEPNLTMSTWEEVQAWKTQWEGSTVQDEERNLEIKSSIAKHFQEGDVLALGTLDGQAWAAVFSPDQYVKLREVCEKNPTLTIKDCPPCKTQASWNTDEFLHNHLDAELAEVKSRAVLREAQEQQPEIQRSVKITESLSSWEEVQAWKNRCDGDTDEVVQEIKADAAQDWQVGQVLVTGTFGEDKWAALFSPEQYQHFKEVCEKTPELTAENFPDKRQMYFFSPNEFMFEMLDKHAPGWEEKDELDWEEKFCERILDKAPAIVQRIKGWFGAEPKVGENPSPATQPEQALQESVRWGKLEAVAILLQQPSIDVNAQAKRGETALHIAAAKGYGQITEQLLIAGAAPNLRNKQGQTPAHLAAQAGQLAPFNKLLGMPQIQPFLSDNKGKTPLDYALKGEHAGIVQALSKHPKFQELQLSDRQRNRIESLLEAKAAQDKEVTAQRAAALASVNKQTAALQEAAFRGDQQAAQEALNRGAKIDALDAAKNTALSYAVQRNNREVAQFLVDQGANPNLGASLPLHESVKTGAMGLTQVLLQAKANVNQLDAAGLSPMHWARKLEKENAVSLLVKHGAECVLSRDGKTPGQLAPKQAKPSYQWDFSSQNQQQEQGFSCSR